MSGSPSKHETDRERGIREAVRMLDDESFWPPEHGLSPGPQSEPLNHPNTAEEEAYIDMLCVCASPGPEARELFEKILAENGGHLPPLPPPRRRK